MKRSTKNHAGAGFKREADIVKDALSLSEAWYDAYIQKHTYEAKAFTSEVTSRLAIARYEWLLSTVRERIFSIFTDEELYDVAKSLQRELAIPKDYSLAVAIAEDNFVLWENYSRSNYRALIDKLLALTPLEDLALRDIIEPFWHGLYAQVEPFSTYIARERDRLVKAALNKS